MTEQQQSFNFTETAAQNGAAQPTQAPTQAPTAPPQAAAPAATENEAVELTVNDLGAIKQIIDVASARGAFKPQEMVSIGTIYNRLDKFLATIASQQQAKEAQNA